MDNVPKETHAVSVMTDQPLETVAVVRDEKDDRLLPHQIRRPRLTKGEKTPQRQAERKALQTKGAKFRAVTKIVKKKKKPSCKNWHPPVCQNCKSATGCKYGRTCFFRHVEAEEKPSKKSKKGGVKESVALLKESTQLGCAFQDSYPRKSFLRKKGKLGSKRAVNFPNSGKKRSIARNHSKV